MMRSVSSVLRCHGCRLASNQSGTLKVVRTDCEQCVPYLVEQLRTRAEVIELPEFGTTEEELMEACRDADVILHCYTPITAQVIQHAEKLRGIVKYGVGIDAIDITAARKRGIPVANIPEYAEGAFMLMIALAKKFKPLQQQMQSKGWAWPSESTLGGDLAGKTLGMVGNGRIGRSMARMAGGFGMKLRCYDPYVSAAAMAEQRVAKVEDIKELCSMSDFVSIHTVLNQETKALLGEEELDCMKETANLINVSRGPIVDEEALVKAVLSGSIAGVGLDVFGAEPLQREGHLFSNIMDLDNVLLTPHLAFWTSEARDRLMLEALERCNELLDGVPLTVLSKDPRLTTQTENVNLGGLSIASGRYVFPER